MEAPASKLSPAGWPAAARRRSGTTWHSTHVLAITGGLLRRSLSPAATASAYFPFCWCRSLYLLLAPWQLSQETPALASPRNTVAWHFTQAPLTS